MNHPPKQLNSADLDWIAFQYVTDGLSESAAADFEATLRHDQSAREALASAVEMTQAVTMIESVADRGAACRSEHTVGRRHGDVWLAPVAWLTVAALACMTFVVLWQPGRFVPSSGSSPGGHPVAARDGAGFDSGELASLWVSTSEFLVTAELVERELFDVAADEEFLGPGGELHDSAEADVDRLEAPSWMMAALTLPSDPNAQE